jgi:hypothetical protein
MGSRRAPLLVLSYAAAAATVVLLDLPSLATIVLVAPLVLVAPGLSLAMALRIDGHPELPWRLVVLSIALSIATTALGGLLVNAFAPLTAESWTIWLVGFTAICCSVAFLRAGPPPTIGVRPRVMQWTPDPGLFLRHWRSAAAGSLVIILLASAAAVTEVSGRDAYNTPIVQLSLEATRGSGGRVVQISVSNLSDHAERLQLTIARGRGPDTIRAANVPAQRTWTASELVGSSGLNAVLTRPDQPGPIGEVSWRRTLAGVPTGLSLFDTRAGWHPVLEIARSILRSAIPARDRRTRQDRTTRGCPQSRRKCAKTHRRTHPRKARGGRSKASPATRGEIHYRARLRAG